MDVVKEGMKLVGVREEDTEGQGEMETDESLWPEPAGNSGMWRYIVYESQFIAGLTKSVHFQFSYGAGG